MISEASATPMLPDAYLHHWSDRYIQLGLHKRGVPLLDFLRDPWLYIHPIDLEILFDDEEGDDVRDEYLPLLPRQRAVQSRLDVEAAEVEAEAGIESLPVRDGHRVEPLHHHRHPRRWRQANFRRRQGGAS